MTNNNDYQEVVIDNTRPDEDQPVVRRSMQEALPQGYEVDEAAGRVPQGGIDFDRIPREDLAKPSFAEGINGREMLDSLVGDSLEKSDEIKQQEAEKTHKQTKKIYATKSMFAKRLNEILEFDIDYPEGPQTFRIRRLNEGEFSGLANRKLWNKDLADMTEREYQDAVSYRRKFLESTIIEPKLTVAEWHSLVDISSLNEIYDKAQDIVLNVNPGDEINDFF